MMQFSRMIVKNPEIKTALESDIFVYEAIGQVDIAEWEKRTENAPASKFFVSFIRLHDNGMVEVVACEDGLPTQFIPLWRVIVLEGPFEVTGVF